MMFPQSLTPRNGWRIVLRNDHSWNREFQLNLNMAFRKHSEKVKTSGREAHNACNRRNPSAHWFDPQFPK